MSSSEGENAELAGQDRIKYKCLMTLENSQAVVCGTVNLGTPFQQGFWNGQWAVETVTGRNGRWRSAPGIW